MSDYTKDNADLVRRSADDDRRDEANASIAKSESEKQQSYLEDEKTVEGDRTSSVSKKEVEGAVVERDGDGEIEDELVYPSGLKLALLTFGLCLVLFVVRTHIFTGVSMSLLRSWQSGRPRQHYYW